MGRGNCDSAGVLTFHTAFDLLQLNPKDPAAHEFLRDRVRAWARFDGFWEQAEDVASEVMLKLAPPGELAKALGRATFKGFIYGYYLNQRRVTIRERREAQKHIDRTAIARAHFAEPASETADGAPRQDLGDAEPGAESDGREFDDVEGFSPETATALDALGRAFPRGLDVVFRRCAGDQYEEIAEDLGITEANARQLYSRAIRFLRDYLGDTGR